jgi:hypothetical protein
MTFTYEEVSHMSPQKGKVDGCGTGIVLIIGVAILALLIPGVIHAQDEWDKSSVTLTGTCLANGQAEFTVSNTGQPMTGETSWREYELDVPTNSGMLQLGADESQVFTFGPVSGAIEFQVDQRPGHPGSSQPHLTLTCQQPTALTLTTFAATSAQPLFNTICQKGVVVGFLSAPGGHVVYVVREGHSFADSYWTTRHFSLTQRVRICAGIIK